MVDVQVINRSEGTILFEGRPCDAREFIQDLLEKRLGFYVDLQESDEQEIIDNEEFEIYLHSDVYDELDETQLTILSEIGITDFNSIPQIENYLDVTIQYSV